MGEANLLRRDVVFLCGLGVLADFLALSFNESGSGGLSSPRPSRHYQFNCARMQKNITSWLWSAIYSIPQEHSKVQFSLKK